MSQFTLDDIRAAAERAYGSTDITVHGDVCRLLNPLRLPKPKRDALMAKQTELEADESDQEAILKDCIRLVAEQPWMADKLLAEIGEDLAVLAQVFKSYTEASESGEASASAN